MPLNIQEPVAETRVEVISLPVDFPPVSPGMRELEQALPPSPFPPPWTLQTPIHRIPKLESQGGRQTPLESFQHFDFSQEIGTWDF